MQEGHLAFQSGAERLAVAAGDIVIILAEAAHKFTNHGRGRSKPVCIHASPTFIGEWLEQAASSRQCRMAPDIRDATPDDWSNIWPIVQEVVVAGDTFAYSPELTKAEARELRMVAAPGRDERRCRERHGSRDREHVRKPCRARRDVASASFMVASTVQGRGVGRALVEDALTWASAAGFRAMQFNAVAEKRRGGQAL